MEYFTVKHENGSQVKFPCDIAIGDYGEDLFNHLMTGSTNERKPGLNFQYSHIISLTIIHETCKQTKPSLFRLFSRRKYYQRPKYKFELKCNGEEIYDTTELVPGCFLLNHFSYLWPLRNINLPFAHPPGSSFDLTIRKERFWPRKRIQFTLPAEPAPASSVLIGAQRKSQSSGSTPQPSSHKSQSYQWSPQPLMRWPVRLCFTPCNVRPASTLESYDVNCNDLTTLVRMPWKQWSLQIELLLITTSLTEKSPGLHNVQ